MKLEFKLALPRMPNFLFLDDEKTYLRQDGLGEKPSIDVAELTNEQAEQFANEWKEAFIKHVITRRITK